MDDGAREPRSPAGQAWSCELLGFAPDARLLIINADDFGMYDAVNTAVIRSVEEGIAGSCSLMAPCPAAPHAMSLLRRHPRVCFGIHLTLVCDTPGYRWGPLAAKERVPSLLDESGELFTPDRAPALLARARLEEVEREFRAQITAVADAGLAPAHLDWHCLADGGRDDIFDLTVALAAEYGLAVRAWLDPARRKLRQRGLPAVDHGFLDSFRLDTDGKQARYARLLRDLPAGLSEWAVHPALGGQQAQAIDPGWRVRRTDYEFLTSPQARAVLRDERITVIGYREIQQAWSRAGKAKLPGDKIPQASWPVWPMPSRRSSDRTTENGQQVAGWVKLRPRRLARAREGGTARLSHLRCRVEAGFSADLSEAVAGSRPGGQD